MFIESCVLSVPLSRNLKRKETIMERNISNIKELADVKPEFVCLDTAKATGRDRSYPYEFFYRKGDVKPWSIQFKGAGHYFRTLDGCLAYGCGRSFYDEHMIETIRAVVELHYRQTFGTDYTGE